MILFVPLPHHFRLIHKYAPYSLSFCFSVCLFNWLVRLVVCLFVYMFSIIILIVALLQFRLFANSTLNELLAAARKRGKKGRVFTNLLTSFNRMNAFASWAMFNFIFVLTLRLNTFFNAFHVAEVFNIAVTLFS